MYADQQHFDTLTESIEELQDQVDDIELATDLSQRLEALFTKTAGARRLTHDRIDQVSRQVTNALHNQLQQYQHNANAAASKFQELAQAFRTRWESVRSEEHTSELQSRGHLV